MSSFNKIIIVGYLGRDPELRYTSQGTAVCKMSIATTDKRKNAAGEIEEHTTWFRVAAWGRQAELANEYLAKGRQLYVEGRLRLEEYTDREGQKRFSAEVSATDIQFLGKRDDSVSAEPGNHQGDEDTEQEEERPTSSKSDRKRRSKGASKKGNSSEEELSSLDNEVPF